jgi:hypothetical protein
MPHGLLFTQEFLTRGVKRHSAWQEVWPETITDLHKSLSSLFQSFPPEQQNINEADTERDLIDPILTLLGWDGERRLYQENATSADIPDYLLFPDAAAKQEARTRKRHPYRYGLTFLEAKAWNVPLGRRSQTPEGEQRTPSGQMLRYLGVVEGASDGAIQWGILTNGRLWRLYYRHATPSRAEGFVEIDLPVILGLPGYQGELSEEGPKHWLTIFYLLFRREAFMQGPQGKTFHEVAYKEGKEWAAKVTQELSDTVFKTVFPQILTALKDHDSQRPDTLTPAYLEEVREGGLILLYRLLFLFYAEDRRLLPAQERRYDDYSLYARRKDLEKRMPTADTYSPMHTDYWHHVAGLFRTIDKGNEALGIPPYNGGLFAPESCPLLERTALPDTPFAPLLYKLSHRVEDKSGEHLWINYHDLSVQHLGSIYERLLEYRPAPQADGTLALTLNPFARKVTGSYYTPEGLVRIVLEGTLAPLLEEALANQKRKDPAEAVLDLKICDPAMGSGHFLVSLVDYLSDTILDILEDYPDSPLHGRIESIRAHIAGEAAAHNWTMPEGKLDDKDIVRRMALKRCVFGVDKNPMAVELAKLALWLHSFTAGAPLSFLDHHLRCGDSLFGEWVGGVQAAMRGRGAPLLPNAFIQSAKAAARGMQTIEALTDADIAEARRSADTFAGVEQATGPLTAFLSLHHALRWVAEPKNPLHTAAINLYLEGQFGDFVDIASGRLALTPPSPEQLAFLEDTADKAPKAVQAELFAQGRAEAKGRLYPVFYALLTRARALAADEAFHHWQVAFPGVWQDWETANPWDGGGFDAVVGNPPWDRMKLQQVEWFSDRRPEIARQASAAKRKALIAALEKAKDPLWDAYQEADWRAATAMARARGDGDFPLLSAGDINLYALFVERAHALIKPTGMVGLVVPSGIAADKTAAPFFKAISTAARLAHLYDFENKKVFFPVVDSRFKLCTYIAGGPRRAFDATHMAFFLHEAHPGLPVLTEYPGVVALMERRTKKKRAAPPDCAFTMTHTDFARVNPNTGTAPIFRSARDADLTRRVYERFPILHDHASGRKVWPVKYCTMFHMTNDSHLFKTREELEAAGYFPIAGGRWKRGEGEFCLPLYVGKMIWHYDHRACSVVVNADNLKVAAGSKPTTPAQHADPAFTPTPQYWVEQRALPDLGVAWGFGLRGITNATNERTLVCNVFPLSGAGNSIGMMVPDGDVKGFKAGVPLLLANMASFVFDCFTRQKVQGQNMNWYIVEQLPVIPPAAFAQKLGAGTIGDFVRGEVLRLTYTAHDMAPFARDMGYDGPPFAWDEDDRAHRKARLDALFFNLYGFTEEEAAYVLSTFPIVERQDRAAHGRFLTRDLICAYMRALAAGDTRSRAEV